eukprot:CAMPEP_0117003402 /NCGR_PEP_ID=MMETSP0472-20121206/4729_1 /TAXON_ID=693140 ORGANISM="Tiarina fusus, Strain LIS" /NCGR_SAMPLE_ID=MMETSP0472 /ASSEMBLY_ACC=CAM_ASM_000603 /LENGTH=208 /DNA_ID=CAMNT_0004704029 /DNA_START=87 /DNA_END=713 /DNA_ORIENTATION=+
MATPIFVPPVTRSEGEKVSAKPMKKAETVASTRRVGFTPLVRVIKVLHLNDFGGDEIDACYYKKSDFERIKADLKLTVRLMQLGKLEEDSLDYCRRGTEYRSPEGARRRARNKEAARDALLDEQDLQWDNFVFDPDVLASVYHEASRECGLEASRLGLRDEDEARAIDAIELPRTPEREEKLETGLRAPLRVTKNVRLRRRSITAFAA